MPYRLLLVILLVFAALAVGSWAMSSARPVEGPSAPVEHSVQLGLFNPAADLDTSRIEDFRPCKTADFSRL